MSGLSILILDDEESLAEELREYLTGLGHFCVATYHPREALSRIEKERFDILLLDLRLPDTDGLEVLQQVRVLQPETEVIVMSGHGDIDSVTRAFRLGAFDFLQKSFTPADVRIAIERTSTYQALQRRYRDLETRHRRVSKEIEELVGSAFVGESVAAGRILEMVDRCAESSSSAVLISGESGTGKELVARMIHYRSPRREGPLVTVNCAAVQNELFESEFFGHVKGAFTGAVSNRTGCVRRAHEGTLFLDEIGELPTAMQAKLLRVLEQGTFLPVGSDSEEKADVRIVAASNRDLRRAITEKSFRSDLYYRLQTLEIFIPPLRERPEDIEPLVRHFLKELSARMGRRCPKLSSEELQTLNAYPFPGNVRELRNLVERAMILSRGDLAFPVPKTSPPPSSTGHGIHAAEEQGRMTADSVSLARSLPTLRLADIERLAIEEALRQAGGVHSRAARLLGVSRQTLSRRMSKYSIVLPE